MVPNHKKQFDARNFEDRETIIPELQIPDEFYGVLREEDVPEKKILDERDKRILLSFSVMEQWRNWTIDTLIEQNRQLRHIEITSIRERKELQGKLQKLEEQQRETSTGYTILKWIGLCLGSAVIVSLIKLIFDKATQ